MALVLDGTNGVSLVQDGVVTAADLSSTLDLTGKTVTLPAGTGGKVLQVVQAIDTTNKVMSGTTYVATNLTASITPTSTSNKVLAIVHGGIDTNAAGRAGAVTLYRDGTTNLAVGSSGFFAYEIGHNSRMQSPFAFSFLDSPNTTSPVTYTVYIKSSDSGQVEMPGTFQDKAITLMEIAG